MAWIPSSGNFAGGDAKDAEDEYENEPGDEAVL
jgi:hypothetical protein